MKIKAGIIGGAGYTGSETLRLLLHHPFVELTFVQSRSQAGKSVQEVHPDLLGETDLKFTSSTSDVDVVFLCLAHGESKKLVAENSIPEKTKIIDLGNDFRIEGIAGPRAFVYGLPEFQREKIRGAKNIANAGCFATTLQLGLLPLAKAGILSEVHATGITGSTGAGQKLQETVHFSWRADNVSPYKTLTHQHMAEINQTFKALQPGFSGAVNFVPWRGAFTRGIFVTSVLECNLTIQDVNKLYKEYYAPHAFTFVTDSVIDMKQVVNTNKCLIFLEKAGNKLAIHSTLDNLLKGASGQAVQNMNLMFGFDEMAGLMLKGSIF